MASIEFNIENSLNGIASKSGVIVNNGFNSYRLVPKGNSDSLDDKIADAVNSSMGSVASTINSLNNEINNNKSSILNLSNNLEEVHLSDAIQGEISSAIVQGTATFVTEDQAGAWYGLQIVQSSNGVEYISGFDTGAILNPSTGVNDSYFRINADTFIVGGDLGDGEGYTGPKDINGEPLPAFSIVQNDEGAPEMYFNGKVSISAIPSSVNKNIGTFPSANDVGVYLANNPSVFESLNVGDSYFNSGEDTVYFWTSLGWSSTAGDDGATGSRGSGIRQYSGSSAFNSTIAAGLFNNNLIAGDQVVWVDTRSVVGGTEIYEWDNGWTTNTALYVNGNAIVSGTLSANDIVSGTMSADRISGGFIDGSSLHADNANNSQGWALSASGTPALFNLSYNNSIFSMNNDSIYSRNCEFEVREGQFGVYYGNPGAAATIYHYGGASSLGLDVNGQIESSGTVTAAGYLPFTGAHIGFSVDDNLLVGDIVSAVGKAHLMSVDDSRHKVSTAKKSKCKSCIGIVSTGDRRDIALELAEWLVDDTYYSYNLNAVGEGGINICSIGGDIESGDYITSSTLAGKGMKQDDDLMHSYTVAKTLEDVIWDDEVVGEGGCFEQDGYKCKMIACVYTCG